MKSMTKSVAFAVVTVASVAAMSGAVSASPATSSPAPKVDVCKYVGKPGEDERLKGGKNPINVSSHAVKGYEQGNKKFNDAQEQSVVVEDGTSCTPESTTPETPVTPGKGGGQVLGETTSAPVSTTSAPTSAVLADTGTSTIGATVLASVLAAVAAYVGLGRKAPEACDLD